jgi:surface protein
MINVNANINRRAILLGGGGISYKSLGTTRWYGTIKCPIEGANNIFAWVYTRPTVSTVQIGFDTNGEISEDCPVFNTTNGNPAGTLGDLITSVSAAEVWILEWRCQLTASNPRISPTSDKGRLWTSASGFERDPDSGKVAIRTTGGTNQGWEDGALSELNFGNSFSISSIVSPASENVGAILGSRNNSLAPQDGVYHFADSRLTNEVIGQIIPNDGSGAISPQGAIQGANDNRRGVVTVGPQNLTVYNKGALENSADISTLSGYTNDQVTIGSRYVSNPSNRFDGHITLIRVHDKELSESEVSQLDQLDIQTIYGDNTSMIMTIDSGVAQSISLPFTSTVGTYDAVIDWGDGNTETLTSSGTKTHAYAENRIYLVKISGVFDMFRFDNGGDKDKILSIQNWGQVVLNEGRHFYGCTNLTSVPVGPIVANALNNSFRGCTSLTVIDMSQWDTSACTQFQNLFRGSTSLVRADVSNLDMSNAGFLNSMFEDCFALTTIVGADTVTPPTGVVRTDSMFRDTAIKGATGFGALAIKPSQGQWAFRDITSTTFDESFAGWDVSNAINLTDFLRNTTVGSDISQANLDATLIAWEASLQAAYPGGVGYPYTIQVSFQGTIYTGGTAAEVAHDSLVNTFGWTIISGGPG